VTGVKQFLWIMVGLVLLSMLLAGPVVARLGHPKADCSNRVSIVTGPNGEPRECVCIDGALAGCFAPGP
jgi:hypothetical protein